MIVELNVENIAIIERAGLELGPGFSALTGETGAGKSLFVDAIELAFGARADTELVRSGAQRALVSVTIDLSHQRELEQMVLELGANVEDHMLFLQREVFAEGRSQCRIGGRMAPLSLLRQLGAMLVDLHGQHDHQSLLHPERHLGFLDDWIGEPARVLIAKVQVELESVRSIERKLNALRQSRRDREHRIDMLRFQVQEIGDFQPRVGELAELDQQIGRLQHAEKLTASAQAALAMLADQEPASAIDLIGESVRSLEDAAKLDASLEHVLEPLRTALYALQDGSHELRNYADALESDPEQLEVALDRQDGLKKLIRKYGDDEAAVLEHFLRAQEELNTLTGGEEGEERLESTLEEARSRLTAICAELTVLRQKHATTFSEQVQVHLRDLAMERAEFSIRMSSKDPDVDGADAMEFTFSANAGEPLRPLSKIASGGEISRVMLAVKTVLAGRAGVPTLIFDEVDVGLGGRAAAVVAKKLEELAGFYQVIVISHLPQIASRATAHFHIQKGESQGRVLTQIKSLGRDERIEEIARMIAGEHVTEAAKIHAREMLELL